MHKLTILFALLTLSAGLWANDNVKYIDAAGVEQTANGVTEITNASTTLSGGWYVVYGADVQTGTLICQGAVHLILADGAKLTTTGEGFGQTPGIQVSGDGNSLTIYAQSTDAATMGQLIATGGMQAAGIGGGFIGSGSYITINGGIVTANGGNGGAGIGGGVIGNGDYITINGGEVMATGGLFGAGIGGGNGGNGSNITINGGWVEIVCAAGAGIGGGDSGSGSNITINGGTINIKNPSNAAGIGGGNGGNGSNIIINGGNVITESVGGAAIGCGHAGQSSNIFVTSSVFLMADGIEVPHFTGYDMATILKDKRSVMLEEGKATAYVEGYNAGKAEGKAEGLEEGKAEAQAELPTEGTSGPAVVITKGEKSVTLINPDEVTYKIIEEE